MEILLKCISEAAGRLGISKFWPHFQRICTFLLHSCVLHAISSTWFWVGSLWFSALASTFILHQLRITFTRRFFYMWRWLIRVIPTDGKPNGWPYIYCPFVRVASCCLITKKIKIQKWDWRLSESTNLPSQSIEENACIHSVRYSNSQELACSPIKKWTVDIAVVRLLPLGFYKRIIFAFFARREFSLPTWARWFQSAGGFGESA